MKQIGLQVTCKYLVDIEIDDVPEEIVEQLENVDGTIKRNSELADWLNNIVHERDAQEWEYEIISTNNLKEEE